MQLLKEIPLRIRVIVFDFDGVLANTVPAKSQAFYDWIPNRYEHVRSAFMQYHMRAYGIGRRQQIEYFFRELVGERVTFDVIDSEVARLSEMIKATIFSAALFSDVVPFLCRLMQAGYIIGVVSGTPHSELIELLQHHQLHGFCKHMLGTPTTKTQGLGTIVAAEGVLPTEVLFFGDANADWSAAISVGTEFVYRPSQVEFTAPHTGWYVRDLNDIRLNSEHLS